MRLTLSQRRDYDQDIIYTRKLDREKIDRHPASYDGAYENMNRSSLAGGHGLHHRHNATAGFQDFNPERLLREGGRRGDDDSSDDGF